MKKESIISTAVDILAIMLCCAAAHLIAHNVTALAKTETIIAVCMGIWVYTPLKAKLKKEAKKL